ncbi:MAG: alkaline phosphatase family protein [Clostridia bacterium]|nr:alkaline phosphatase family protein [Clostridia bacterium]
MKKITSLLLTLIFVLGIFSVPSYAAETLQKIEDDFENGYDETLWRKTSDSGAELDTFAKDGNAENHAAYVSKAANSRLMNYYKNTAFTGRAIFEFDLAVDYCTSTTSFFKFYSPETSTSVRLETKRLLTYDSAKEVVYITEYPTASAALKLDTWCSVKIDVTCATGEYSAYIDGKLLKDSSGRTSFPISASSGSVDANTNIITTQICCSAESGLWIDDVFWRTPVFADEFGKNFEIESASVSDGASNVGVNPVLEYTFTHNIKPGTENAIAINNDTNYIKETEVSGDTLTITLAKPLNYGTEYKLSFGDLEADYGSFTDDSITFTTLTSYGMLEENFDDGRYNDTKLNTAGKYDPAGNSGNEFKIVNSPLPRYSGDKSFLISCMESGTNAYIHTEQGYNFSDETTVKFKILIDEETTTGALTLLDVRSDDEMGASTTNASLLYFYNNDAKPRDIRVRTRGADGASTYVSTGKTWSKGEWVEIALQFDISNDKFKIAVNGEPCEEEYTLFKPTNNAKKISRINFTCNTPVAKFYIDDVQLSRTIIADKSSAYGFYNKNGNAICLLDPKDTVYKASIINRGAFDENLVLYLAGYDKTENTLERLDVVDCVVPSNGILNVEEHIENLKEDVSQLRYKAFYVKDEESLEPYGSESGLTRCEIAPGNEYDPSDDSYKHVVIVGVDGMGTFSNKTSTPNMDNIFAQGAFTDDMLVAIPTSSSHSWASCLTGVTPDLHALNDNTLVETTTRDPESKFPTILRIVSEEIPGADVASIATWSGINVGIVETIDNDDSINGKIYKYRNGDANGTAEAVRYITEELSYDNKSLTYIHLNDPDAIGHANGYGSSAHLAEITDVDNQIGQIYDAIEAKGIMEDTLFIVTTDHGGTPKGTHGQLTDAEKFAIFGIKGKTVPQGSTIGDMEIRDTAAIVLTALGLDVPEYMSARVPDGVFEGITAGERNVYYDPDNPRYHVPTATPAKASEAYVTNFVDEELVTYFPFDGNLNESLGNVMSTDGEIKYEPGYFGNGVNLDNGSLILNNYDTAKDSYTISTWVKTPCAYSRPIFTTKGWNGTTNCSSKGHILAFARDTSLENPYYALFNFHDGTNKMSFTTPLPEDYDRGWMHLLYIVDRDAGTISIAFDFGEPVTVPMESDNGVSMAASSMSTSYGGKLFIGNDYPKGFGDSAGLSLDEFMMFNGAFNRNDINDLARYYGIETGIADIEESENIRAHKPVSTPSKDSSAYITNYITDNNLEIYMPFDKSTENTAAASTVSEIGTIKYREGYFGNGLYLNSYVDYLTVDDYKLSTDSFSSSFWLNVNSINGSTTPIFSTQDLASTGTKGQGISVYLSNSNRLGVQIGDGSSYDRAYFDLPENYNDGWMHVTFVYDRVGKQFLVSFDFNEFQSYKIATTSLLAKTADGKEGCKFSIGQGGDGKYWTPFHATIDEFMIFDGVLDSYDLAALKSYYGK